MFAGNDRNITRHSKQAVQRRKDGQEWCPNPEARGGRAKFLDKKSIGKNKDYTKTCSLEEALKKEPELREQSLFCVEVQSVDDPSKTFMRNGCRCCSSVSSKYTITGPNGVKGMGLPGSVGRLKDHCNGNRHILKCNTWKAHGLNLQGIKECVSQNEEAVPEEVLIFRQAYLEACSIDGVPLTTVCGPDSALRDLLEVTFGVSLVEANQMQKNHEEAALKKCVDSARALVQNRNYGVLFDGTDHHGNLECMLMRVVVDGVSSLFSFLVFLLFRGSLLDTSNIILSFVQDRVPSKTNGSSGPARFETINQCKPVVRQLVVACSFSKGSPTGPELASTLNSMVTCCEGSDGTPQFHGAGCNWNDCCALMCDGSSVNKDAINILQGTGPGSWGIGAKFTPVLCFAHCFNNAGKELKFHLSHELYSSLSNLISRSAPAKALWRECTGSSFQAASKVRWFSQLNCMCDIHK